MSAPPYHTVHHMRLENPVCDRHSSVDPVTDSLRASDTSYRLHQHLDMPASRGSPRGVM